MTLTNQQVFDNALNQVRKQKYMRSINYERECCAYRGEHGLKCAVGASIPDSLYTPDIENKTAFDLLLRRPFSELFRHVNSDLLSDLQRLHDGDIMQGIEPDEDIPQDEFEAGMERLASKWGLVYNPR